MIIYQPLKTVSNFQKLLILMIAFSCFSCSSSSTQNEQHAEGQSDGTTTDQTIDEEPVDVIVETKEVTFENLMQYIESGESIPLAHFDEKEIFEKDADLDIRYNIILNDPNKDQIAGILEAAERPTAEVKQIFLATFSKNNGRIRSYEFIGGIPSSSSFEQEFTFDSWHDKYMLSRKKGSVKAPNPPGIKEKTYIVALSYNVEFLDTLDISYEEILRASHENDLVPPDHLYIFTMKQGWQMDEKDTFSIEYINEVSDYLVAKLSHEYVDNSNQDYVDEYLVSFSKVKKGIWESMQWLTGYPKMLEEKNEVLFEKKGSQNNQFAINVHHVSQYSDDRKKLNFYLHDNGELSDKEYISSDQYGFLDFIARFKSSGDDLRAYENEDYYHSFMKLDYGGPVTLTHLIANNDLQVFRVNWGEMETELDHIWVYDNNGQRLSECGDLPAEDVAIQVNSIETDTLSVNPIIINFITSWTEFEVKDDGGGMPERGDKIMDVESTYQLTLDNGKCKMTQL